jgi:hypothetical protein
MSSLLLSTDQKRALLFGNIGLYNSSFYKKLKGGSKINSVIQAKTALLDTERSYNSVREWFNRENKTLLIIRPTFNDHHYVCQARYEAAKNYIKILESLLPDDIKDRLAKGVDLPAIDEQTVEATYKRIVTTGDP